MTRSSMMWPMLGSDRDLSKSATSMNNLLSWEQPISEFLVGSGNKGHAVVGKAANH